MRTKASQKKKTIDNNISSSAILEVESYSSVILSAPLGPPHHAIWGHFLVMRDTASSLPPDAIPQLFAHLLSQRYGLCDFFYLDLWPLAPPQLVIVQPELAMQIVQKMNFPKGSVVITYPFIVLVNDCATMHREDLFKDAGRFYPERYLVTDPADPYFVRKDE